MGIIPVGATAPLALWLGPRGKTQETGAAPTLCAQRGYVADCVAGNRAKVIMSISAMSATKWCLILAFVGVLVPIVAVFLSLLRRKPKGRAQRIEAYHVRPLVGCDRTRFLRYWREVQEHRVDDDAGAVTGADRLLCDVMSTRGYPLGDFEQRATDIFADHPRVLENYRAAHEIAILHIRKEANAKELREAMVHYQALFEELVNEPEMPLAKAAS